MRFSFSTSAVIAFLGASWLVAASNPSDVELLMRSAVNTPRNLTNAERISHGLAPNRPKRLFNPSRTHAPRSGPSGTADITKPIGQLAFTIPSSNGLQKRGLGLTYYASVVGGILTLVEDVQLASSFLLPYFDGSGDLASMSWIPDADSAGFIKGELYQMFATIEQDIAELDFAITLPVGAKTSLFAPPGADGVLMPQLNQGDVSNLQASLWVADADLAMYLSPTLAIALAELTDPLVMLATTFLTGTTPDFTNAQAQADAIAQAQADAKAEADAKVLQNPVMMYATRSDGSGAYMSITLNQFYGFSAVPDQSSATTFYLPTTGNGQVDQTIYAKVGDDAVTLTFDLNNGAGLITILDDTNATSAAIFGVPYAGTGEINIHLSDRLWQMYAAPDYSALYSCDDYTDCMNLGRGLVPICLELVTVGSTPNTCASYAAYTKTNPFELYAVSQKGDIHGYLGTINGGVITFEQTAAEGQTLYVPNYTPQGQQFSVFAVTEIGESPLVAPPLQGIAGAGPFSFSFDSAYSAQSLQFASLEDAIVAAPSPENSYVQPMNWYIAPDSGGIYTFASDDAAHSVFPNAQQLCIETLFNGDAPSKCSTYFQPSDAQNPVQLYVTKVSPGGDPISGWVVDSQEFMNVVQDQGSASTFYFPGFDGTNKTQNLFASASDGTMAITIANPSPRGDHGGGAAQVFITPYQQVGGGLVKVSSLNGGVVTPVINFDGTTSDWGWFYIKWQTELFIISDYDTAVQYNDVFVQVCMETVPVGGTPVGTCNGLIQAPIPTVILEVGLGYVGNMGNLPADAVARDAVYNTQGLCEAGCLASGNTLSWFDSTTLSCYCSDSGPNINTIVDSGTSDAYFVNAITATYTWQGCFSTSHPGNIVESQVTYANTPNDCFAFCGTAPQLVIQPDATFGQWKCSCYEENIASTLSDIGTCNGQSYLWYTQPGETKPNPNPTVMPNVIPVPGADSSTGYVGSTRSPPQESTPMQGNYDNPVTCDADCATGGFYYSYFFLAASACTCSAYGPNTNMLYNTQFQNDNYYVNYLGTSFEYSTCISSIDNSLYAPALQQSSITPDGCFSACEGFTSMLLYPASNQDDYGGPTTGPDSTDIWQCQCYSQDVSPALGPGAGKCDSNVWIYYTNPAASTTTSTEAPQPTDPTPSTTSDAGPTTTMSTSATSSPSKSPSAFDPPQSTPLVYPAPCAAPAQNTALASVGDASTNVKLAIQYQAADQKDPAMTGGSTTLKRRNGMSARTVAWDQGQYLFVDGNGVQIGPTAYVNPGPSTLSFPLMDPTNPGPTMLADGNYAGQQIVASPRYDPATGIYYYQLVITATPSPADITQPFSLASGSAILISHDNCGNPIFWVNDEATFNIYGFSSYQQAVALFDYVFEICFESYDPSGSPTGLCSNSLPVVNIGVTDQSTGQTYGLTFRDYNGVYATSSPSDTFFLPNYHDGMPYPQNIVTQSSDFVSFIPFTLALNGYNGEELNGAAQVVMSGDPFRVQTTFTQIPSENSIITPDVNILGQIATWGWYMKSDFSIWVAETYYLALSQIGTDITAVCLEVYTDTPGSCAATVTGNASSGRSPFNH